MTNQSLETLARVSKLTPDGTKLTVAYFKTKEQALTALENAKKAENPVVFVIDCFRAIPTDGEQNGY